MGCRAPPQQANTGLVGDPGSRDERLLAKAARGGDPAIAPHRAKTGRVGDPAIAPPRAKTRRVGDPASRRAGTLDADTASGSVFQTDHYRRSLAGKRSQLDTIGVWTSAAAGRIIALSC